ncbi:MAG: hypothetical protein AAF481_02395 [Acidobacteriota bacterium]
MSRHVNAADELGELRSLGSLTVRPIAAADTSADRALAAWTGGRGNEVVGRLLDSSGLPLTSEFNIGSVDATIRSVAVGGHPEGFAVAWSTDLELWLRHFDLDGNALDEPKFLRSPASADFVETFGSTTVAADADRTVLLYSEFDGHDVGIVKSLSIDRRTGDEETTILHRVLNRILARIRPIALALANGPADRFVAAWGPRDLDDSNLALQVLDGRGRPVSKVRRAVENGRLRPENSIALDVSNGGSIVAGWTESASYQAPSTAHFRAFDLRLNPFGPARPLSDVRGTYRDPEVAFTGRDRLVAMAQVQKEVLITAPEAPPFLSAHRSALTCGSSESVVCLQEGRFKVSVDVQDDISPSGRAATAVPVTSDTGSFWFFSEDNVELLVKVLDGRPVNGNFWVMFGSLSNLPYTVRVRDTLTHIEREFTNPRGRLASRAIVDAFPDDGSPPIATARVQEAPSGGCDDTAMALCLTGGRFRATVDWLDPRSGRSGTATGQLLADNSGAFWLFGPENLELILKVLDGTSSNGHHWVFVGGLTDVELDIRVDDLFTGQSWQHHKEPFELKSFADIEALPLAPISPPN